MGFIVCHSSVFDSLGNHVHLASFERDSPITHLDFERALEYKEEVVCLRVCMPNELALDLHDHEIVAIERADSSWTPVLAECAEFLREIDCAIGHVRSWWIDLRFQTARACSLLPNVRAKLPAEGRSVSLVRDDASRAADQAYAACRSGSA
jgi:hypothetical protein